LTGPLVPHFGAHSLFYPHRCIRLEQVSPAAPYISSRPATGICLDLRTLPDTDVSALLEGFWPLGFIAAGLLAHAVLPVGGWRWVFLIEAIPSVFVFVVRFMVPESPRWLAVSGQMAAAENVVLKFERAVAARLHDGVLPEPRPEPAERAAGARSSFMELWSGPYLRRTTMLWLLWFLALLGYYGLTTWLAALLQDAGYSVTQSIYYTTLISLLVCRGFSRRRM
jgi:putative MFS transporter